MQFADIVSYYRIRYCISRASLILKANRLEIFNTTFSLSEQKL